MKKIRIIFLGSLIVFALGLLTACNNTTGNDNKGNGTITTTPGNNNGAMDDIKEGAEDIATDMGIDNNDNNTNTTTK